MSAFFTNVYLILKTSNCVKAGSKNISVPDEVTHDSKYRRLGVLNSHSRRQTWACPITQFAFCVNSETKGPSSKILCILIREDKTRKMAVRPFLKHSLSLSILVCTTCFCHCKLHPPPLERQTQDWDIVVLLNVEEIMVYFYHYHLEFSFFMNIRTRIF